VVSADGRGVVNHVGSRLLADLADAPGLTASFTDALRRLRPRGAGHAPGTIAVDLAVMLADGGEAITDLALLRDQAEVFGPVASTPGSPLRTQRCTRQWWGPRRPRRQPLRCLP
jgi:hypothetical protein